MASRVSYKWPKISAALEDRIRSGYSRGSYIRKRGLS